MMISDIGKTIVQAVANSENYISSEDLSKICNVSINTIRKEIDMVNVFLQDHGCAIETKMASGYYLTMKDPKQGQIFLQQLLKDIRQFRYMNYAEYSSAYIILMKLLTSSGYTTIETLMECLYCSKSTVFRTLDQTTLILDQFHLTLKNRRNSGLYLEGSEWSKRLCLIFLHKVFIHENPELTRRGIFASYFLNQTDFPQRIRTVVLRFFACHRQLTIPGIHMIKISQFILLSHSRSHYSHELSLSTAQKQRLQQHGLIDIASQLAGQLPPVFRQEITNSEIEALAALIACCMSFSSPEQIPQPALSKIRQEINELIEFIEKYYEIGSCFDEPFYQSFACYLYSLNLKQEFHFSTDEEELSNSTKDGLLSADLSSLFALFYWTRHQIFLREADLSDAYYIFNRALFCNNTYYQKIRLAIVSRHGRYYSENLSARLKAGFARYIRSVDIFEYSELNDLDLRLYDALITDINRKTLPSDYTGQIIDLRLRHALNDSNYLASFLLQRFNNRARLLFREKNFHKTNFSCQQEVIEAIYDLFRNEIGDHDRFIRDLRMRDSFISYEREKNVVLITPLALRLEKPVFELFVNRKPILWQRRKASVFIFYQQGDGSPENVQIISYLLKQFIHQNDLFLNTLYRRSYRDIISIFHIL